MARPLSALTDRASVRFCPHEVAGRDPGTHRWALCPSTGLGHEPKRPVRCSAEGGETMGQVLGAGINPAVVHAVNKTRGYVCCSPTVERHAQRKENTRSGRWPGAKDHAQRDNEQGARRINTDLIAERCVLPCFLHTLRLCAQCRLSMIYLSFSPISDDSALFKHLYSVRTGKRHAMKQPLCIVQPLMRGNFNAERYS